MLTSENLPLAEYFPVGEILADELDARGWSQSEFAEMIGRPTQFVSDLLNDKKDLTSASASQLEAAMGIQAATWLGLQADYRLWQQQQNDRLVADNQTIKTRALVSENLILSHLRKRGVLSSDLSAGAEQEELQNLMDRMDSLALAARRADSHKVLSREQCTWIVCAQHHASQIDLPNFDAEKLEELAPQISEAASSLEGFSDLPARLSSAGVGLIYEPTVARGKMDGVTFMRESNPIIALSGRGKRLDKVLFALLHEIAHIHLGHLNERGFVLDLVLDHEATGREGEANDQAQDWILPSIDCPNKITRASVEAIAQKYRVNKAVVVGRLQYEGRIPWKSQIARGLVDVMPALERW